MQINQLQVNPKKNFGASMGFKPMASLLGPQCSNNSLWRPIHWEQANLIVETMKMKWAEIQIQMKIWSSQWLG